MTNKLENWYQQQITTHLIVADDEQINIIKIFDKFITNFEHHQKNLFSKLLNPMDKTHRFGFYIHGPVGRGKSMLMTAFYKQINTPYKTRIHFHEFMQNIQSELSQLKHQKFPLTQVAKNLKKHYRIIFLDEMQVSDIANAMILKNLFENLFTQKIYLVISSNFAPDGLYPDGLMRSRFLPAIELLNKQLNVIEIRGTQDYRLKNLSNNNLFHINNPSANDALNAIFQDLCSSNSYKANHTITIKHRQIPYIKMDTNIIWFDFMVICGNQRSQLDYIELSANFDWFIISNIFRLNPDNKDIARRFTLIIDILYDNNKKLALSSNCPINEIYPAGDFANEFVRTVSRLQEMQTTEYFDKPTRL